MKWGHNTPCAWYADICILDLDVSRPEELDSVTICDILGGGGFGAVYSRTYQGSKVAIKVLPHGGACNLSSEKVEVCSVQLCT